MGPNLFAREEGAVLQVALAPREGPALVLAWRTMARQLATRLNWPLPRTVVRWHPGGAQLFLSAPVDALLAATEVNEQAWAVAERIVAGAPAGDLDDLLARLRVHAQHERSPALAQLHEAAASRHVTFTFDEEHVSLGAGEGSMTWARSALPGWQEVPWDALHDIPVALVTGSNGKTTTTRLLAAMLAAAGFVPGYTSTDGVWCAGEPVEHGDYAGPVGARLVLRDRRVTAAVLEVARGGMLRRGLATARADVAIVTRVSADHMGEYGIHDLHALGEAKLIVERALVPGGRLVLNAEDDTLVTMAPQRRAPITWFALDVQALSVQLARARGEELCVLRDGELWHLAAEREVSLGAVARMPLTLGGAARHNVANALAAAAAALALDVPVVAIRRTLEQFGASPDDNPGRLALLTYRGARVVVDFAHNPDGWHALWDALAGVRATRRIALVGQGGDRDDRALDELADAVWAGRPAIVILKEMPKYLRGREFGKVTERLTTAFLSMGAPATSIRRADDEPTGVQQALDESRPGDLLVLSVHTDFDAVMRQLHAAGATSVATLDPVSVG
jgi:UDP-N-acetylmuramyl tripeptide synthase